MELKSHTTFIRNSDLYYNTHYNIYISKYSRLLHLIDDSESNSIKRIDIHVENMLIIDNLLYALRNNTIYIYYLPSMTIGNVCSILCVLGNIVVIGKNGDYRIFPTEKSTKALYSNMELIADKYRPNVIISACVTCDKVLLLYANGMTRLLDL